MERHVTILGVLYLVFGLMGVFAAILVFVLVTGGGLISGDRDAILITGAVGTAVGAFLMIVSLPGVICGIALLRRLSWGRILALIVGALNLLNIPLGTALGIYTIWAMMNPEITAMFDRKAVSSTPAGRPS